MNLNLSPIQDELSKLEAVRDFIANKNKELEAVDWHKLKGLLTEREYDKVERGWIGQHRLLKILSELVK